MINVYTAQDFESANKSKKAILRWFYISLALMLAVNIAIFVFYTMQEFNTSLRVPLMLTNIISCSIYAIIMFFIFAIKYKRVASYVTMLKDMQEGLKVEGVNAFVRIDSSLNRKNGVDFISIVVLEWSEKKQEYYERNILFDVEKPVPEFKKGDFIKHVTHANILISYELASTEIFE